MVANGGAGRGRLRAERGCHADERHSDGAGVANQAICYEYSQGDAVIHAAGHTQGRAGKDEELIFGGGRAGIANGDKDDARRSEQGMEPTPR